jgi:hypothetical protein
MPSGTVVYWLATTEEEIHFIDAIVSAYDGLAGVRRDFKIEEGRSMYKVYVSAGMEEEFLELMERLTERARIDAVVRGEDDETTEG